MSGFRRSRRLVTAVLVCGVLVGLAGWLVSPIRSGAPITGPIEAYLGQGTAVVFPDGSVVYLRDHGAPVGGRLAAPTWALVRRLMTSGRLASEDETDGGCLDGTYRYGVAGPGLDVSWVPCDSAGGPSSRIWIWGAPVLSEVLTLLATGDRHGLDPLPEPPAGPPRRALTVVRAWTDAGRPGGEQAVTGTPAPLTVEVTAGGEVTMLDGSGRVVGGRHLDRGTADALQLLLGVVPVTSPGPVELTCTTARYSREISGPVLVPVITSCRFPPGSASPADGRASIWLAAFVDLALTMPITAAVGGPARSR